MTMKFWLGNMEKKLPRIDISNEAEIQLLLAHPTEKIS